MIPASYLDAHCHLTDPRVRSLAPEIVMRALAAGTRRIAMGGVDASDARAQRTLREEFPEVLRTRFGLHPWRVEELGAEGCAREMEELEELFPWAHAIGETGLDFHAKRNPAFFRLQEEVFRLQLRVAGRLRKPLVLHIVAAHEPAVRIMEEERIEVPVMIHSFSGSAEQARTWVRRGATLSYSGAILRSGFRKVREALAATPLDQILLETDFPDQAWDAEPNEPRRMGEIYRAAAQILGVTEPTLIQKTNANFEKFG